MRSLHAACGLLLAMQCSATTTKLTQTGSTETTTTTNTITAKATTMLKTTTAKPATATIGKTTGTTAPAIILKPPATTVVKPTTTPVVKTATTTTAAVLKTTTTTKNHPSVTTALASSVTANQTASGLNVVYWGQNGGGTAENNNLSTYCTSAAGIDVIVLAFLYQWGNGYEFASGRIGRSCSISNAGVPSQCSGLAATIGTCQAAGVKIMLSLGGANGAYSLSSRAEAETIGQHLWDAFSRVGANASVPRPFGANHVDGWDFDIEASRGNQYYQYLIAKLRSNFASDANLTYYITGSPQCPIPEAYMGQIITTSRFDYLWVQFYNNNRCSATGPINFNSWVSFLSSTPSRQARVLIGVPAGPYSKSYISPTRLASLVAKYRASPAFGGVMMWNAGQSDSNIAYGCTYAQQARAILLTGSPCVPGAGPVPGPAHAVNNSNSITTTTTARLSTLLTQTTLTTRYSAALNATAVALTRLVPSSSPPAFSITTITTRATANATQVATTSAPKAAALTSGLHL